MLQSLLSGNLDIASLLYRLPAILISLSFHEWAHAYAAYRAGDPTARNLGRMTINPLNHIDPIGFICLLLFRFGWAKPVPVNPRNFNNFKRDNIMVSLAGIITNFGLTVVSTLCLYIYLFAGGNNLPILQIIQNFLYINLALMIFNLIPIPPLDGSHVLETLLMHKLGPRPFEFLHRYGQVILIVLLLSNVINMIMQSLMSVIIGGLFWAFNGVFGVFI